MQGQTGWVPIVVRFLMAPIGAIAIAVGIVRFRVAVECADEAAPVDAIPKPLRSVAIYRMSALMTGVVGAAFVAVALLAP